MPTHTKRHRYAYPVATLTSKSGKIAAVFLSVAVLSAICGCSKNSKQSAADNTPAVVHAAAPAVSSAPQPTPEAAVGSAATSGGNEASSADTPPIQSESQQVKVDEANGTIDAMVEGFVISTDDAPQWWDIHSVPDGGVYKMDFGDATLAASLPGGSPMFCVGRQFIAKGTFVKRDCTALQMNKTVLLHYVSGTPVLAYIPPQEEQKEMPAYVDLFMTTLPIMALQAPHGTFGGKVGDPDLGHGWSDVTYQVGQDDPSNGTFAITDVNTGDALNLSCVGLQIPRNGRQTALVPQFCPALTADVDDGGYRVPVMVLMTSDHSRYWFGVENDDELAHRSAYLYVVK